MEQLEQARKYLIDEEPEKAREILGRLKDNPPPELTADNMWRVHELLGAYFHDTGDAEGAVQAYLNAARADIFLRMQRQHYSNYLFALHYLDLVGGERDFSTIKRQLAAEHFAADNLYAVETLPPPAWNHNDKIRVGYLAPQIADSAVMRFAEVMLADYDHENFAVTVYVMEKSANEYAQNLRSKVDAWRELAEVTWEESAQIIRRDEIDILFDLGGHSAGGITLSVMAYRPAKRQISGIGWFDTTGLGAVDYLLSDEFLTPPGEEEFFREKLLRLPHAFCFAPPSNILNNCGENRRGKSFVFGAMANFMKVTDDCLRTWRTICERVTDSRLILQDVTPLKSRQDYMRRRLSELSFAARVELRPSRKNFWEDFAEIDLMLDTFPYNGGAMTASALCAGVPTLTLRGLTYGSRFGLSILEAAGFSELVAADRQSYIKSATDLAGDRRQFEKLKRELKTKIKNSPLTDKKTYMKNLQRAYRDVARGEPCQLRRRVV